MVTINFLHNYNNKLYSDVFLCCRLSTKDWKRGEVYSIKHNGDKCGEALLVDKQDYILEALPENVSYLDTGENSLFHEEYLKSAYSDFNIDWSTKKISVLTLKYLN